METENSSKYIVPLYQPTRHYVADVGNLQHGSEDLKLSGRDP
jgi:hypothetical protein